MSEPVNDIVCTILQKPLPQWSVDERDDLLTCERPTPYLDISVRREVKSLGKSYNLKFRTTWYDTNEWLCGSYYRKKLYCWPCLLLGARKIAWNYNGFCDLKNANRAFKYHMKSEDHMECAELLKNLRRRMVVNCTSTSSCASPPPQFLHFSPQSSHSSPPPSPPPPPPPPLTTYEPVNDLVCNLLEKPFGRWDDRDRLDLVTFGRPTPLLDISVRREVLKRKKSYNIKFRTVWYKKFDWLCGSYYLKKLYCWPCLLLGNKRLTWNFTGFCDLKNVNRSVQSHGRSMEHADCVKKLKIFENNMKRDVEHCIAQHTLIKEWSGTSSPPAPWNPGTLGDAFETDCASLVYQGSLADKFESDMEIIKEEIVESEEILSPSSGFIVDENVDEEEDNLQIDEFPVEVQVKLEPEGVVKEEETFSLTDGEEKQEEILLNPEFIPVEEESDSDRFDQFQTPKLSTEERVAIVIWRIQGKECSEIRNEFKRKFKKAGPRDNIIDYFVKKFKRTGSVIDEIKNGQQCTSCSNRNSMIAEASINAGGYSSDSNSLMEEMNPALGESALFVRCNYMGDKIEGSDVFRETKLLKILQMRKQVRESLLHLKKMQNSHRKKRDLCQSADNFYRTQESLQRARFLKEKREREKRRRQTETEEERRIRLEKSRQRAKMRRINHAGAIAGDSEQK